MKRIIAALILILIALVAAGCSREYTTSDGCITDCIKKGHDTGTCVWPEEAKEGTVQIGTCWFQGTKYCGTRGKCGCMCEDKALYAPPGSMSIKDLLKDPIYKRNVTIYGVVSALGERLCSCFELKSGKDSITVWYAGMQDPDELEPRTGVNIDNIDNGDFVVIRGELRSGKTFWSNKIDVLE